jgi:hypothetical protein
MDPLDFFFFCSLALLLPAGILVLAGATLLRNGSTAAGLVILTLGVLLGVTSCSAVYLWLRLRLPTEVIGVWRIMMAARYFA